MNFRRSILLTIFALFPLSGQASDSTDASIPNMSSEAQAQKRYPHINDIVTIRLVEPHYINLGEIKMDVLFRLGKHFSLGPSAALMSSNNGVHAGATEYDLAFYSNKTKRTQLGLRGAYFFKHVNKSSAYLSIHARAVKTEVESSSDISTTHGTGEFNSTVSGATAGYQWTVGILKLAIGGGFETHHLPESLKINYDNGAQYTLIFRNEDSSSLIIDGGIGVTF